MRNTWILSVLFLIFAASTVFGELIDTFDYQTDSCKITVSGTLGSEFQYKYVSMTVYKTGKSLLDLSSGQRGILNWYDQTKAGASGEYAFSFIMKGDNGADYTLSIAAEGSDAVYEEHFTYFGVEENTNIWNKIVSAKTGNDYTIIQWIVQNRMDYLKLNTDFYKTLSEDSKIQLYKSILAQNMSSVQEFKNIFYETSRVWHLNEITDEQSYIAFLEELKGSDTRVSDDYYKTFDETAQKAVIEAMMAVDYLQYKDVIQDYNTMVITKKINSAQIWGDFYNVLNECSVILEIDTAEYNKLSDKAAAIKKMMDNEEYTKLSQIKDAFNKAVALQKESEEEKESSGSKKGGSSGGGAGSHNLTAIVSDVIETPPPKSINAEFEDLADVAWAAESISELKGRGIVSGNGESRFLPNNHITRLNL